jgi:hypothetical protein
MGRPRCSKYWGTKIDLELRTSKPVGRKQQAAHKNVCCKMEWFYSSRELIVHTGESVAALYPSDCTGILRGKPQVQSCIYARHGKFSMVHRSRQVRLAGNTGGGFPALPLAVMFPTITERNLRSRGQTFHSVTGAFTALGLFLIKELRDWWVLLAAAGASLHSGQRGLLRCVSFPRCGCRADVNSRQK